MSADIKSYRYYLSYYGLVWGIFFAAFLVTIWAIIPWMQVLGVISPSSVSLDNMWLWLIGQALIGAIFAGLYSYRVRRNKGFSRKKKYDKMNADQALFLPGGTVRGFLMLIVATILLSLLVFRQTIPMHFLIAFIVILGYYGIKTENILPSKYLVRVPEDYGKISRMPMLSDAIDEIQKKISSIIKKIKKFLNAGDKTLQAWMAKNQANYDELKKRINDFEEAYENLNVKPKNLLERLGLIFIVLVIVVINVVIFSQSPGSIPINPISIALAGSLSIVSIVLGVNIQELLISPVKERLEEANKSVQASLGTLQNVISNPKNKLSNVEAKVNKVLNDIKASNILIFMPKTWVAIVTINLMVYVVGLAFVIPQLLLNESFLIVVEVIIGYYFLTKK